MSTLMSGARMLLECLVREGVDCMFGYPGRRHASLLRRALRPPHPPRAGAPRGERRFRRGRLRARHRQGGRLLRHLRSRRHQPDHRPGGRHDGFHPHRRHHRPGHQQADRQRRLPGSRHLRHHALLHQAQLPGEAPGGPAADRPRSVLHRLQRAARPGAGGYSQGRVPGPGPLPAGDVDPPARLQGLHRRPHRADPPRRAIDPGSRAAAGLCGRRHHRGRRRRRTARVRGTDRRARGDHPDGSGRAALRPSQFHQHARHARQLRRQHGPDRLRSARSPWACASTIASPAAWPPSRRTPR